MDRPCPTYLLQGSSPASGFFASSTRQAISIMQWIRKSDHSKKKGIVGGHRGGQWKELN
jgi:hypothetical protein